MFCSKCGKEVGNDELFCRFCGNKVIGITNNNENSKTVNNTYNSQNNRNIQGGNNTYNSQNNGYNQNVSESKNVFDEIYESSSNGTSNYGTSSYDDKPNVLLGVLSILITPLGIILAIVSFNQGKPKCGKQYLFDALVAPIIIFIVFTILPFMFG